MIDLTGKDFFKIKNNFDAFANIHSKRLYGERRERPSVSIMIPTFLRNNYLSETIDSVINQDVDIDYEVVVVDNNPDMLDLDTLNVLKQYDPQLVSYYKNSENLGMFGNWNRCLELAHAEWVLILHDDDTITRDYLRKMLDIVNKYPYTSCVGCGYTMIDENSKIKEEAPKGIKWRLAERFLKRKSYPVRIKDFFYIHPINIMGLFVNKQRAIEIGGFDNTWDPTSDYVFILNMAYRFKVRCTDEKLLNYRQAVNASLSTKNLIGMVEVDAFMRKFINDRLKIMDEIKAKTFRSAVVLNHERSLKSNWFFTLNSTQKKQVEDEYLSFNQFMKLETVAESVKRRIIKMQGYYIFWVRFFRQ